MMIAMIMLLRQVIVAPCGEQEQDEDVFIEQETHETSDIMGLVACLRADVHGMVVGAACLVFVNGRPLG